MAFTYDGGNVATVDLDFVRFETGDVDSTAAVLDDATITALIVLNGTKKKAVIAALTHKWALLTNPDFRADWLKVEHGAAQKSIERLIAAKRREYGLPESVATVTHVYRPDSLHTEEPDYT